MIATLLFLRYSKARGLIRQADETFESTPLIDENERINFETSNVKFVKVDVPAMLLLAGQNRDPQIFQLTYRILLT